MATLRFTRNLGSGIMGNPRVRTRLLGLARNFGSGIILRTRARRGFSLGLARNFGSGIIVVVSKMERAG